MDFLADEMDGLGIRREGDAHAFCGRRFLIARRSRRGDRRISRRGLGTAGAAIAFAIAATRAASAVVAVRGHRGAAGVVAGFGIRSWVRVLLAVAGGTRPRGSKRKTGQQAAQWIVFGIAHGAHSRERF